MKLAFWRREPAQSETRDARDLREPRGRPRAAADPDRDDATRQLKVRARRRLIGAAALLLAAVILVPMLLDPAPRPVADNIPIEIPSEKTPFSPRLPLPPDPAQAQPAPPPDAASPGEERKDDAPAAATDRAGDKESGKADEKAAGGTADKAADRSAEPAAKAAAKAAPGDDGQRARDLLEGRSPGKYVLQVAALASEKAAGELAARLKKDGHPAYTERTQAGGSTRWRVRVGPFASRAEADRVRNRLREAGVGAQLVP